MAKTLHFGLPLSLYTLARGMVKMPDGKQAVESMLAVAWTTGLVSPDQLRLIADSVNVALWPANPNLIK